MLKKRISIAALIASPAICAAVYPYVTAGSPELLLPDEGAGKIKPVPLLADDLKQLETGLGGKSMRRGTGVIARITCRPVARCPEGPAGSETTQTQWASRT